MLLALRIPEAFALKPILFFVSALIFASLSSLLISSSVSVSSSGKISSVSSESTSTSVSVIFSSGSSVGVSVTDSSFLSSTLGTTEFVLRPLSFEFLSPFSTVSTKSFANSYESISVGKERYSGTAPFANLPPASIRFVPLK